MVSFAVFVLGLIVGSFLNAVIYRLEKGESALQGRSYCPKCRHSLVWYDLIPLLSFLFLQGKCRYCKEKISLQYPLVELATGLLFVSLLLSFPQVPELLYLWAIASLLLVIFVYDLHHYIIPDKILFSAIGLVVLQRVFEAWTFDSWDLTGVVLSALGAALLFFLIFLLTRGRAMGFGDVKLAFFMGLFLSWPNILVALFFAFSIEAFVGVALIFFKKKNMKSEVPFAPFLITGTFLALFWGEQLVDWYLSLVVV